MKFPTEDELRKMNMTELKKHVREMNEHYGIKGYSKLRKDQLINAIMTSQLRIKKGAPKETMKPIEMTVNKDIVEAKKKEMKPKKETKEPAKKPKKKAKLVIVDDKPKKKVMKKKSKTSTSDTLKSASEFLKSLTD